VGTADPEARAAADLVDGVAVGSGTAAKAVVVREADGNSRSGQVVAPPARGSRPRSREGPSWRIGTLRQMHGAAPASLAAAVGLAVRGIDGACRCPKRRLEEEGTQATAAALLRGVVAGTTSSPDKS
jgi:hypothetical protein